MSTYAAILVPISPYFLKILIIVSLNSLFAKSNIWIISDFASLDCFFLPDYQLVFLGSSLFLVNFNFMLDVKDNTL